MQSGATETDSTRLEPKNRLAVVGCALLPALCFALIHLRALDYPFVWTDVSAIGQRTMIRPAGEILAAFGEPLHRIQFRGESASQPYYRPLQVVTLSLATLWFGDSPRAYRSVTIAAGALCVAAWAWLAGLLLRSPIAASIAAVLVALHPVAIESTVWISGVSGSLCALFTIVAIGLAIRAVTSRHATAAIGFGGGSLLALVAGLLSKERAAIEPLLLAATLLAIAQRPDPHVDRRRAIALGVLHAGVSLGYMTLWRASIVGGLPGLPPIGGSWSTQILTAVASWPDSIGWIFAPLHPATSDLVAVVSGTPDARFWFGFALAVGSAALALALFRRRPLAALGIVWIWIAFAPTAGLIPMLHASGERYRLLSSFGAALFVVDGVPALLAGRRAARPLIAGLVVVCALALGARTWTRLSDWRSTQTLFGPAVERDPRYREGHFLLARDELDRGHTASASRRLDALLEAHDASVASYLNPVSTLELACSVRLADGDYAGVVALDASAARRNPATRNAPTFRTCVGQAKNALGDTEAAQQIYLSVAAELGAAAPPQLSVMILRNWIKLGRAAEARAALTAARSAAAGSVELQPQLARLTERLRALEAGSAVR